MNLQSRWLHESKIVNQGKAVRSRACNFITINVSLKSVTEENEVCGWSEIPQRVRVSGCLAAVSEAARVEKKQRCSTRCFARVFDRRLSRCQRFSVAIVMIAVVIVSVPMAVVVVAKPVAIAI